MDIRFKYAVLTIGVASVLFTLMMTLYKEFVKKENASGWALACMVLSSLNMILVNLMKHL